MASQNKTVVALAVFALLLSAPALAQSKQYQRKRAAPAVVAPAPVTGEKSDVKAAAPTTPPATKTDSEKLDITDLEKKYWAPKDTDFSVVQNRTYTKAKRVSTSLLAGPIVNDAFNAGYNYSLNVNYYLDERYGFEAMYIKSSLSNSNVTDNFIAGMGGGQTSPDFNRPESYYGVGFNYVPFYAKMSFMGKKIIYFDMQITPHLGMSSYEQQTNAGVGAVKSNAFTYGIDVTQYFFFSKNWAVRANLHNRWYKEDVVYYKTNLSRRSDTANITNFLMGFTFFF